MFKDIKDQIVTVLGTITGSGKVLKAVFGYPEPSPQQYPCAVVHFIEATEERLDTASNFVTVKFGIRVMLREKNTLAANDQRLDILEAVHAAFRSHTYIDTLGGHCQKFDFGQVTMLNATEDQPVFGFDLIALAGKIELIT